MLMEEPVVFLKPWDWAWDKENQFAQWANEVGIPSANIGYGMSSSGQIQPVGNINRQSLFKNKSQHTDNLQVHLDMPDNP